MKKETPPKEAILDAMEVAETSPEAARYTADQYQKIVTAAKADSSCAEIVDKLNKFADLVAFKFLSTSQPWFGEPVETSDFKNMQANTAIDAAKNLEEEHKNVTFGIAINDQSEFLRGYTADGKEMTATSVESYDKLFNAYLASNDMKSKDSILYEIDAKGAIKRDEQGNQVKANPEKAKELISNKEQGFDQYAASKNLNITTRQQDYPTPQKVSEAQQEVREAIDQTPGVESQSNMRSGA